MTLHISKSRLASPLRRFWAAVNPVIIAGGSLRGPLGTGRSLFVASVTGIALCTTTMSAQAQIPGSGGSRAELHHIVKRSANSSEPKAAQSRTEPNLLPFLKPEASVEDPESETPFYLVSLKDRRADRQAQRSEKRRSDAETSEQDAPVMGDSGAPQGFLGRLGKIFRNDDNLPNSPPPDPGMVYPKASDPRSLSSTPVPAAPPRAPGATSEVIPSIPPTVVKSQQPGLFPAPSSANAIDGLVPPLPGGTNSVAAQPKPNPSAPQTNVQVQGVDLQEIPPLNALMVSEEADNAPEPKMTQRSNVPAPQIDAPLPQPAQQIAPGEPSSPQSAPAQTAQAVPPAVSTGESDPFANLFPGDTTKPAEEETLVSAPPPAPDQAPAMAQEEAEVTQPYTGLSLNDDSSKPEPELLPPPPKADDTQVAETEMPAPTTTAANEETASTAPSQPSAPKLDLSVPEDLPKLSSTDEPGIQIKPAQPAQEADSANAANTAKQQASAPAPEDDHQSKMEMIAARKDLKGLKGFCPVVLRDQRDLVDASFEFMVSYNGRDYALSSREAQAKFEADPAKYAPAHGGCDVIHLALTGEELEGSLEHAVWYKGRLYLFASVETLETFVAAPSSHATDQ